MTDAPAALANAAPDRSLLPEGLRRLIFIRYKAKLRRTLMGSGKRRLYTFVGLGLMALYLVPRLFTRTGQPPLKPDAVRLWLPIVLLLIVIPQLLFRTRRDPMSFQPAELDLVVPGPFSRRQLLLYQIAYQFGPLLLMGLWMGVFIRAGSSYWATSIAAALIGQLVMLLTVISSALLGLLLARARWLIPALLLVIAAIAFGITRQAPPFPAGDTSKFPEWALAVRHTPIIESLCAPLSPYVNTLLSTSLPEALRPASLCLLINLALIALFIALDRGELEALVAHSQKRLEQTQRSRRGSVRIANPRRAAARRIPMPPRWAGAGTLLWRQLTTLYRGGGPVVAAMLALALVAGPFWLRPTLRAPNTVPIMALCATLVTFFLSMFLRCDFRDDLDHLPTLKSLPFSPFAVVAGQIAAPALLIATVNTLLLSGLIAAAGRSGLAPIALGIVAASVPIAAALLAIENTIFLIAPVRPYAQAAAAGFDPSLVGRHFLVSIVKLLAFAAAALIIGGPVALILFLRAGPILAIAVGLIGTLVLVATLLLACTAAFRAFDVAGDQPA